MRTLLTSLLLALALVALGATHGAAACSLQSAQAPAFGLVTPGTPAGDASMVETSSCGPVAAAPASEDADDDHDGPDQGPERVGSDAFLVATIGLDAPASSALLYRAASELHPDSPTADRTQQPPRS